MSFVLSDGWAAVAQPEAVFWRWGNPKNASCIRSS